MLRAILLITLTATLAGCELGPSDAMAPGAPSAESRPVRISPAGVGVAERSERGAANAVHRFAGAFARWLHGERWRELPGMPADAERELRIHPPRLPPGERRGPASVQLVELVFQTGRSGVFAIHILGPARATISPGTFARHGRRWQITGLSAGH